MDETHSAGHACLNLIIFPLGVNVSDIRKLLCTVISILCMSTVEIAHLDIITSLGLARETLIVSNGSQGRARRNGRALKDAILGR